MFLGLQPRLGLQTFAYNNRESKKQSGFATHHTPLILTLCWSLPTWSFCSCPWNPSQRAAAPTLHPSHHSCSAAPSPCCSSPPLKPTHPSENHFLFNSRLQQFPSQSWSLPDSAPTKAPSPQTFRVRPRMKATKIWTLRSRKIPLLPEWDIADTANRPKFPVIWSCLFELERPCCFTAWLPQC